jgi:hypothetical protein
MKDEDITRLQGIVFDYLETHDFVTNRILRGIANVTYDQAISFFGEMVNRDTLKSRNSERNSIHS